MIEHGAINTPIGRLHVFARERATVFIDLRDDLPAVARQIRRRFGDEPIADAADPAGAVSALRRYFAGDLAALDPLPVDPGGTPFQASVWRALRAIPAGVTLSYRELARRIGAPNAVRAVGAANGANPVPLIIPCHRVIGTSGSLVGYGGGVERKDWLLRHEGWRPLAP
jgi:methylated-DNA-[protein]-cysteine S-methyltransferase